MPQATLESKTVWTPEVNYGEGRTYAQTDPPPKPKVLASMIGNVGEAAAMLQYDVDRLRGMADAVFGCVPEISNGRTAKDRDTLSPPLATQADVAIATLSNVLSDLRAQIDRLGGI